MISIKDILRIRGAIRGALHAAADDTGEFLLGLSFA